MFRTGSYLAGPLAGPIINLRRGLYWLEKTHTAGNREATALYEAMLTIKDGSTHR